MKICTDPYAVNLVLVGMIVKMSFKFVARIGFKKVSYKKGQGIIFRKRSPQAAGVKNLKINQASDPIIFILYLGISSKSAYSNPTSKSQENTDSILISTMKTFGFQAFVHMDRQLSLQKLARSIHL